MLDADHVDPVLVQYRENEARKALVVGVQVDTDSYDGYHMRALIVGTKSCEVDHSYGSASHFSF